LDFKLPDLNQTITQLHEAVCVALLRDCQNSSDPRCKLTDFLFLNPKENENIEPKQFKQISKHFRADGIKKHVSDMCRMLIHIGIIMAINVIGIFLFAISAVIRLYFHI
jgi:hypothetical protein